MGVKSPGLKKTFFKLSDTLMEIVLYKPIRSRVVRVKRQAGILLLDGALRWTKSKAE